MMVEVAANGQFSSQIDILVPFRLVAARCALLGAGSCSCRNRCRRYE